jgi:hypothetical protein
MKIVAKRTGDNSTGYTNQLFKLDNGQIITDEEAYDWAKEGKLEGVVAVTNKGNKYVRGVADGDPNNNIDSLPTF